MRMDYSEGLLKSFQLMLEKQAAGRLPIVLIDGRAAAGKSSFANQLAELYFKSEKQAARIISMDDLYPGWDGLASGSLYLLSHILSPLAQTKTAHWQVWDWAENRRGAADAVNGQREFSGGTALIIEGCGSISRQTSELSDLCVWLEADAAVRKTRFHQRDSGRFDGYFATWSAQEDEYYQREKSAELAQIIIEN